jgi:3'-5' exonuclease
MPDSSVRYLVFDIESIADGDLVAKIRYPGQSLSAEEAINRYRAELAEKTESEFIPYTFHIPVSIVIAKVDVHYRLLDVVALDAPQYRPHVIVENFWRGWQGYKMPTLVSFNGRSFDLPLLELSSFRFGISMPGWFALTDKSWENKRNRFNANYHLDLHDILTNYGATRFYGGLNLVANLLGKPGKMDVNGYMVQQMHQAGQSEQINDYCRCDVLDTYFVFLRTVLMMGHLSLDQEHELVENTRTWITQQSDNVPAYQQYLEQWGDWKNPWTSE